MKNFTLLKTGVVLVLAMLCFPLQKVDACTRAVYKGPNGMIITGRTMDFTLEIPANHWIFPRGMKRNGEVGKNSIEWTSKYGSLAVSAWDISVVDGMNEKGLVANRSEERRVGKECRARWSGYG